jgi:hypothetical protein
MLYGGGQVRGRHGANKKQFAATARALIASSAAVTLKLFHLVLFWRRRRRAPRRLLKFTAAHSVRARVFVRGALPGIASIPLSQEIN